MRILAIDPGCSESALVGWDGQRITGAQKVLNDHALGILKQEVLTRAFDSCVIEMVASYGMPVGREVFETCVWIGRIMEVIGAEKINRVPRIQVKSHICHSGKAKDSNIRQALIDRFGAPGTKKAPGLTYGLKADTWQAFALAVYWHDKQAIEARIRA